MRPVTNSLPAADRENQPRHPVWRVRRCSVVKQGAAVRCYIRQRVQVVYADESIWLTQKMMGMLYDGNYNTLHYKLPAIIAVGYKVNSERAVQFRKWATGIIAQFTIKAYVMDRERISAGGSVLTEQCRRRSKIPTGE